jgi:hypothetical protein
MSTFFLGLFFLVIATLLRFALHMGSSTPWYQRVSATLLPVDLRKKTKDSASFFLQLLGLVLLISGIGYYLLTVSYELSGWIGKLLGLLPLWGPGLFFAGLAKWLHAKYWSKHIR